MHAVSAADLRRIAKLMRSQVKYLAEQNKIALDNVGSVANLQRLGGVDDIVRSQAIVQPARGGGIADGFAHIHRKRNDVVLYARFQFVNARDIHFGALANDRSGIFRHEASFRKRFGGGQLDVEPLLEAIRIAPDLAHIFAGITRNQTLSPWA